MSAVLLWKEYRQQRSVWYLILLSSLLMALMMFGVFGHGEGWHQFRIERPLVFTILLVILAASQGVIAGSLLLVEEAEAGTAAFLDYLSGSRRQLFANKFVAGMFCVLSQGLILACLNLAFGVGNWETILLVFGFGLDAFTWGLLAGAFFRSGLVAILSSIGMFALSWPVSLILMAIAQALLPARDSTVGTVVVISTRTILALGALAAARYIYCRSDYSRGSVTGLRVSKLFDFLPADMNVLLWLLLRQGRWILAIAVPVSLLGSVAVASSPFIIWPIGSLAFGLIFGLYCLAPEQPDAVKFLGAQRFPAGKIWSVKVLFWFISLAVLAGLAWLLVTRAKWSHYFQNEYGYFYYYTQGIGLGNRILLVAIWPLYGFCFGLFFGQITTRPIIGFFLSLFFAPVITFLWAPSLLMGGVPVLWVLAIPFILVALSRFLMRPWLSGRLFSARPLRAIALAVALIMFSIVAFPWYRTAQIPYTGEPFDMAVFIAALDAAKKNEAGQLLRDARVDLKAHEELIEKEFSLPREVPEQDPEREWAQSVPSKRWYNVLETGWNQKDKELERWMDRLFEGQWAANAEKATQSPLGIVVDPRQIGLSNNYSSASHEIGEPAPLFAARALQLQAKGDSRAALDKLVAALSICRQLRNFAPSVFNYSAMAKEETVLGGYLLWVDKLGPNEKLLKAGLLALQKHQAAIPNPVETIEADYLINIRNEPEIFYTKGHDKSVVELYRLAYSLPWEGYRQSQVVRTIAANRLKRMADLIRTQIYTMPEADKIAYPHWSYGYLSPFYDPTWRVAINMQHNNVAQLATAVLIYQADNGRLPGKLDELVPKYVAKLPVNTYDGQPLGYRISKGEVIQTANLTVAEGQAVITWTRRYSSSDRPNVMIHKPLPVWAK